VQAARQARQNAQRIRLLAAERAERLELQLKDVAESGARTEISRTIAVRARLQAEKRKRTARFASVAALGLLFGAATSGLALVATQRAEAPTLEMQRASPLGAVPGDKLVLALSYRISDPVAR
jgi:sensor c-di-GMP phosphodiesterase-like protein